MKTRSLFNWFNRISYIVFYMLLGYFTKDCGVGFYFIPFLLYGSIYFVCMDSLMATVSKMVSVRNYRGLHESSKRVLSYGIIYSLLISIVAFLVFYISGEFILKRLIGSSVPVLIIKCFAVYFTLKAFANCIIGYIRGKGYNSIYHIYLLINGFLLMLLCPFVIKFCYGYGEKVAALLKNNLFAYIFGVAGAIAVQIFALLIATLVSGILYIKSNKHPIGEEYNSMRGVENRRNFFSNLFSVTVSSFSNYIFSILTFCVICFIYLISAVKAGMNTYEISVNTGIIFGKYLLICAFPICIYLEYIKYEKTKIHNAFIKEEPNNVRFRAQNIIKNCLFLLLPITVIVITLANPIVRIFFDGKMDIVVKMLYRGGVLIFLAGATLSCKNILFGIQKKYTAMICGLISFLLTLLFSFLLHKYKVDSFNIIYSLIIFYLVDTVLLFSALFKLISLNLRDIISRSIKIILALIAMIVCEIILDKLLVMNIFLLILSVLIGYIIYYAVNILLKNLNKRDIQSLKGSFLYIPLSFISKKFNMK